MNAALAIGAGIARSPNVARHERALQNAPWQVLAMLFGSLFYSVVGRLRC